MAKIGVESFLFFSLYIYIWFGDTNISEVLTSRPFLIQRNENYNDKLIVTLMQKVIC